MFLIIGSAQGRTILDSDLLLGNGVDEDITFEAEIGLVDNPKIVFDSATDEWQKCVAGTCEDIGSSAAAAIQLAYEASADGQIEVDGTRTSFEIRDNATPIAGILFEVISNDEATNYFSQSASLMSVGTDAEFDSTGYISPPVGTDLERPGTPTTFDFRGSSDQDCIEMYDGSAWACLATGSFIPALAKGELVVGDGSGNVAKAACADDEILVWDALEADGIKCEAKPNTDGVNAVISALDIDWDSADVHYKDISADSTFTFSNASDGQTIIVILNNTDVNPHAITWPAGILESPNYDGNVEATTESVFTFIQSNSKIYLSEIKELQ